MSDPINLAETTVVKAGNCFCVALRDGRLPLGADHPLGVYVDDCRHLRGYELRIRGQPPRLLISSDDAGDAAVFELTTQGLVLTGGPSGELLEALRVRVERRMRPASMVDRITLHSYAREAVEFDLELVLDADFRPMLEVRGMVEPHDREVTRDARGDTLRLAATGLDDRERSTTVRSATATAEADGRLRVPVRLDAGEEATVQVDFSFSQDGDAGSAVVSVPTAHAGAEADAWLSERTRIAVDDELVGRVLRRSLLDMRLLGSELESHRYPAAGVPWYATLFGRDSIIAALEMLPFDGAMAEQCLRLLAGLLGDRLDDEHDEEPGKVLHELRVGELAARGLTPLARYYGTVDATPLFLCLLCEHANWTGSLELFRELRPEVEAALRWIDEYGDLDGDSLLEYRCRSSAGLENQGWKDSWDAIVDEEGELLRAPIALVEPQGYAMAAKRRLARLFELDGDGAAAASLREGAARIGAAIERFWLPDRGFYSMALDAGKHPSRALASNQGHLLWAAALPRDRAAAVRSALMSAGSYSGWGVRTLSADERAFNPVGYHLGTVWPHDNALFAIGLRKYALDDAFLSVFEGLLDAAGSFSEYRLPELFAGFARTEYEDPVPYPVACRPQAWAAGALPALLIAGLGIVPNALERRLCITRPSLPRQLSRLGLQGLRVGDATVDLEFERIATRPDRVALADVRIDGDVDVVLHIGAGRDQLAPTIEQADRPGDLLTSA
jgi:glycogen debranching enzyme